MKSKDLERTRKEFSETGLTLTDIRDILLVVRGDQVEIEMLEELKNRNRDPRTASLLQ